MRFNAAELCRERRWTPGVRLVGDEGRNRARRFFAFVQMRHRRFLGKQLLRAVSVLGRYT